MEDDQSTNTAANDADTSVTDDDTSSNDDTQDTEFDQATARALAEGETDGDADTDDNDESTGSDGEADDGESADDATNQDESNKDRQADDKEQIDRSKLSDDERRRYDHEMAQRRMAERQQAKASQQQEYLDAAEDDKDLALRQLQVDAYNTKIERSVNTLETGIQRAVASIDLFRTGTPEVQEELAASLDYFDKMYVQRDKNGDPINVNGDVYQFLNERAASLKKIMGAGARSEKTAARKVSAATIPTPARAPKAAKKDPILDILSAD